MSSTSGTIRDTVRETARDAKDAARESGKAASAASGDIQADLQALRDDVTRLASQITDIFAAKGNAALHDTCCRARHRLPVWRDVAQIICRSR